MKPASRVSDLARISDLAQLLDSRALLTSLRESRWEALKDISRRATLNALIDTVLGRRGPRRAYLMSLLRRMTARNTLLDQEQLAALLSVQAELRPGIGHYGFFRAEHG